MSEDIHEVSKSTYFAPLRSVSHLGARERLTRERKRYKERQKKKAEDAAVSQEKETLLDLAHEVEAANALLNAAGSDVRMRLVIEAGEPVVQIVVPGDHDHVVAQRISPDHIEEWLGSAETPEGLIFDESM